MNHENKADEILFAPDEQDTITETAEGWKVLIVDDDKDIHSVTRIALDNFVHKGKKIKFLDTYSGTETKKVLQEHPDIAIILLDVVMETTHAGMETVKYLREELHNRFTRIILRTGQAGQAPEREVISAYEINDYKTKTELTATRLFTVILAGLRSYEALIEIDNYNRTLEQKVKERTKELQEERDKVHHQKKDITDSIHYAQRIQRALLPDPVFLADILPEHFILYLPRDIVSGDFYWIWKRGKKLFLVAADCTGHGVPGAFMSMLGTAIINEVINNIYGHITASEILDLLRENVIKALHQKGIEGESKDGMDIAFCMIDADTNILQFAGANNPLWVIKKQQEAVAVGSETPELPTCLPAGKAINCQLPTTNCQLPTTAADYQLLELKGDKMPIAIYDNMQSFTNYMIQLEKGDTLYIFSDGFADQFGGPKGKKFMYKPLKDTLCKIHHLSMHDQKETLHNIFEEWKGDHEQIDDVLIIGVRI
ncbi:MAG: SpoIIE family protein phosphatase [Bacteroidetes bacterium]|nr:SpoIIE family protein phosphatase [Bacteroidota bacterium]